MSEEKENKAKLIDRLRLRYRLVVMNDETFEEKVSLSLTPMQLVVFLISTGIVMIVLVTSLIAFTPLREYIPGYADVSIWRKLITISNRSDSLEREMVLKNQYLENITNVLQGKEEILAMEEEPEETDTTRKYKNLNIKPSTNEVKLREEVELSQEEYTIVQKPVAKKADISNYLFFTPLKGIVSNSFKPGEKHFGVDVVANQNEPIKSTMDGTVILATWSSETGHTITVQHNNHIISVYKHNSVLLKKVGNSVKAGEPIAIIGNSGEHSSGPHLHFELWYNGNAIDPQEYISF